MNQPRNEYPRPQFQRKEWLNLNGSWDFAFDDQNIGIQEKWYLQFPNALEIQVPFAYQTKLSGIFDPTFHDVIWYKRSINVPGAWNGKEILLHFGAVDYRAWVYVNGQLVKYHEGGNVPFHANITDLLKKDGNEVAVRVEDPSTDETIPRGKQYWHEQSESIFYTRTSGIWQTVWLEPVESCRIDQVKFTPDIDTGDITVECNVRLPIRPVASSASRLTLETLIYFQDQLIVANHSTVLEPYTKQTYHLRNRRIDRSNAHGPGWYWSPEAPNLFRVVFQLRNDDRVLDEVESYFGMRKISVENGQILLNNKPYYMKLVLDQGYFPDGLLTAPSDDDLKRDIELAKEMGFNGARKHQKVEDPRYLYWADRLGFLVWGEMANCVEFSEDAIRRLTTEWIEVVERDYNHPSLVAWVPINESWGVSRILLDPRQQSHATALYYLTKSLDTTRLVMSNDGWEHTFSDLCTIHNYQDAEKMKQAYKSIDSSISTTPAGRMIYAQGYAYRGEPILITEYGGIAYQVDQTNGWGYSAVNSAEELVEAYRAVTEALFESPVLQGFCYTQLTDVEQEINGLLTYDRKPKCDLAKIKEINDRVK
ncbi:glycoside hydrolase family 2 [Fodinisporobacter ferrooxydans]|uniref:Glycoside hydrolase family 2 n=1 Tax=Fodinisporobacter ferrooxydans TaxID=2901836 RepID=A0ABY4CS10_9BACL|nr:glycoside hydrolase family 2 [Alicyclobacillaceae bacterium MYW30-H2]